MPRRPVRLLYSVYAVYFICGLAQCFEGLFLPEFKERMHLSYTEQMYILFAKNIPFVCFSIAIGYAARRFGFKNCLAMALLLFALGTFLLIPGLRSGNYGMVLVAFFIIGLGFNVELVAGNPLLSELGDPQHSSSRLNVGNALGAVAQIIAPLFVVAVIPGSVRSIEGRINYIQAIFMGTTVVLTAMAFYTFFITKAFSGSNDSFSGSDFSAGGANDFSYGSKVPATGSFSPDPKTIPIWRRPKIMLGLIALFLVLGFEASLFGFYRNFVEDKGIAGLSAHQSQAMFTVYFAMFALGRLIGSYIQRKIAPAATLVFGLLAALPLLYLVIWAKGLLAVAALTAIGFFASIFFPTLFSLAIEGLNEEKGYASGLLTMGFLGGAVVPVLQGKLADMAGLPLSFTIGFIPYVFALFYVWKSRAGNIFRRTRITEKITT